MPPITLARVLRDVYAPPPAGARSHQVRRLFRDFFAGKSGQMKVNHWCKYRFYAHFMNLKRDAWPGAIESLLHMEPAAALDQVDAFKSWIRASGRSGSLDKGGYERPFMYKLLQLAKARGIISWSYPNSGQILERKAWTRVLPEFRDSVCKYSEFLRGLNHQPSSIACNRSTLRHFGEWLKARRACHYKVDDEVVREWIGWVVSKNTFGDAYKQALISKPRNFYRWLRMRRVIRENPFEGLGRFKVKESLPTVCTEREVLRLIRAANTAFERAIIEVLYATGCRVSEVCGMDWKEMSLDERHAKILGKWRRERMVLFNGAACRAIKAYLPVRAAVLKRERQAKQDAFFVNQAGSRLEPRHIQITLRNLVARAGLGRRITPHAIRHSFATHLLNHGADLFTLMHLLGHKSLSATVRYLKLATVRLAAVYKKCHPRK
jgi:site-specific recombinase XerD